MGWPSARPPEAPPLEPGGAPFFAPSPLLYFSGRGFPDGIRLVKVPSADGVFLATGAGMIPGRWTCWARKRWLQACCGLLGCWGWTYSGWLLFLDTAGSACGRLWRSALGWLLALASSWLLRPWIEAVWSQLGSHFSAWGWGKCLRFSFSLPPFTRRDNA